MPKVLTRLLILLLLTAGTVALPACGKKGPLYLPEHQQAGK